MKPETMIIEGVNGKRARSIYYGVAASSLGCLAATLLQLQSLTRWEDMTRWKDKDMVVPTSLVGALFFFYAVLVIRSLCVPIPRITYRTVEEVTPWSHVTVSVMVFMFLLSHEVHSVMICVYLVGTFAGGMAVMQLNWPVGHVYIQHVVFTNVLCCLSCYLSFQPHDGPAFYVLISLVTLSIVVNYILDKALLPSTTVYSSSRFRDLDV